MAKASTTEYRNRCVPPLDVYVQIPDGASRRCNHRETVKLTKAEIEHPSNKHVKGFIEDGQWVIAGSKDDHEPDPQKRIKDELAECHKTIHEWSMKYGEALREIDELKALLKERTTGAAVNLDEGDEEAKALSDRTYAELQGIAKELGIPANQAIPDLISQITEAQSE